MLRGVELVDCVLEDCELSGTTWEAATLRRVRLQRCRMAGFTAPELVATHVRFDECALAGAWLRMGRFDHCTFESCDLTESDLYGASFAASAVLRCTLDRAELSGASLREVALHGTTIEGVTGVPSVQDVAHRTRADRELRRPGAPRRRLPRHRRARRPRLTRRSGHRRQHPGVGAIEVALRRRDEDGLRALGDEGIEPVAHLVHGR